MEFVKNYKIENIKMWDKNPRKNEVAVEKLIPLIEKYGFVNPVIIDQHGTLRAGHTRVKAMIKLGYAEVPAIIYDFDSEADAIGYAIADNRVSEVAEWDNEKLFDILNELQEQDFDLSMTGFDLSELEVKLENNESSFDKVGKDRIVGLNNKYIVPPFSILDARQGYWLERKKSWFELIKDNAETRENLIGANFGTSILDPVLAEIVIKWFSPYEKGNNIFDCFAGDTTFGFVSSYLGNKFTGIELRKEQCDLNNSRTSELAEYINDDGRNILNYLQKESMDLFFSCPPYYDLEVYSDDERDASNQDSYEEFYKIIEEAFVNSIKILKDNRFAVVVCGDVRNKKNGAYYDFIGDIKKTFIENGLLLYNELILVDVVGTARLRANNSMINRKIVKTHQNVLVFYKGDTKKIKKEFINLGGYDYESTDVQ